ncbi:MAG: hypothetical protein PHV68_08175 [Candidatus Gastranaerophilales bacterium]|nr:hypothetical protein [Candidatus Gastranaerophilales bacterium]
MIIKAFSEYLKNSDTTTNTPLDILAKWLKEILSGEPADNIEKVIHTEIRMKKFDNERTFEGKSKTGNNLLKSLYNFAQSYDQQNFNRWLHEIKASDFKI